MSQLQQVRDAIFNVMGESMAVSILGHEDLMSALDVCEGTGKKITEIESVASKVRRRIVEDTYTGAEDPGEWAPSAIAVIHCENGIDSGYYEPYFFDKWFEVSNQLDGMFCEHHNAAIICVYPA